MNDFEPLDSQLAGAWKALDPSERQIRAMQQRLPDPRPISLFQEWIDLLRVRPALTGTFAVASTFAILALTPAGLLPLLLLKLVGPSVSLP
jgi:hypothetical protein